MDEQRIRQIIRQEIQGAIAQSAFSMKNVPQHTHTGTAGDAPKIPASNIIPGTRASGVITMSTDGRVYRIGTNFNASEISFYGIIRNSGSGIRAQVIGNAQLGPTYRLLDDGTGNSVSAGGTLQSIIQGSSFMLTDAGTAGGDPALVAATAGVSEENIAQVLFPTASDIPAVATVVGYGPGFADIQVFLDSGWEILGYFVVT